MKTTNGTFPSAVGYGNGFRARSVSAYVGYTTTNTVAQHGHKEDVGMAWTTQRLSCIGLEINGYLPAEF